MTRTRYILAGLSLAALALALTLPVFSARHAKPEQTAPGPLVTNAGPVAAPVRNPASSRNRQPAAAPEAFSASDQAFIDRLRLRFAAVIHQSRHAHIKALEQLIAYLQATYPDDWMDRAPGFLQALFPEIALELIREFEALLGYNDWLRRHRPQLLAMESDARRDAIWRARHEAFGRAAAEEIWRGERQGEQLHAALKQLAQADGRSVSEKATAFRAAVEQAYGEQAGRFLERRRTEVLGRFTGQPAIQAHLRRLAPSERRAELRRVREALGMDEAALARWEELDQVRDARWDAGEQYWRERQALLAAGDDDASALAALQDRYFGPEAEIIRSEEASGFYRYDHPRRYGLE